MLIRDPGWSTVRRVYELTGEATIGGLGEDIDLDVGIQGPLAVVAWSDDRWRIRPCSPSVKLDELPLLDEVELRHGQTIADLERGWRLRFMVGDRESALDELRHVETVIDGLTHLLNRRVAYQMLERMTSGAVMLIDIDWLKMINDRYGMMAGDLSIRRTANILRAHVVWPDVVARYGGEEFVVLMPHRDLAEARAIAEQIRRASEATFEHEGELLTATVSIGVAAHIGEGRAALQAADQALADAKRQGRNRVVG